MTAHDDKADLTALMLGKFKHKRVCPASDVNILKEASQTQRTMLSL